MHRHQSRELVIRAEVMSPFDIIRSASIVNAELLNRAGEIGIIAPGARADLIAVDGDPLACILSFSMMLRYSFDMAEEADLVEGAVRRALASGVRTSDIVQPNTGRVSTRVMGDTVLRELEKAA